MAVEESLQFNVFEIHSNEDDKVIDLRAGTPRFEYRESVFSPYVEVTAYLVDTGNTVPTDDKERWKWCAKGNFRDVLVKIGSLMLFNIIITCNATIILLFYDLIFKEKQSINLDQSKDFNLLKNKFSNLDKENSINVKTINELKIQLDNLVGKLANTKNISSQLSTKNNLLEKELSTLLSKNETFEDKINELNKKIENQIKEIKKLKDISHHN